MNPQELELRLEEVTQSLAVEFGGSVGLDRVRNCVAAAGSHFTDARIDAYLSLFVARRARALLEMSIRPTPHPDLGAA